MSPLSDLDASLDVVPDKKSGRYLIVLDVKSVAGENALEVPFKIYFAKSQLAAAMAQVSRFEAEGLRDKYDPDRPVVNERQDRREALPTRREAEALPIYREREIIREVVKVRCRHCGTLFEERLSCCPHCGAPP